MGGSNPQITHVSVFHLLRNRVMGKIDYIYIQIKYLDKSSTHKLCHKKVKILFLVRDKFVQRSSPSCPSPKGLQC